MYRATISAVCASPKRPQRPVPREDVDKNTDEDNEQEIDFGSFSWYGDEEDRTIEEPLEILEVESRKRPRPKVKSSIKKPPFISILT